jgi:hypothetical protein
MKKAFYLLLILIIMGLVYLKYLMPKEAPVAVVPSPSPVASVTPVVTNLKTLDTPYFSLEYSVDATMSSNTNPDSMEWGISMMGEDQKKSGRTQTELFDGYGYTITRFEVVEPEGSAKTQAATDRQGTLDACPESSELTPIKSSNFAGHDSLTFTGGCLGIATHNYFVDQDALYRISYMNVGRPELQKQYQVAIDQMTASLKFKK